MVLCIIGWQQRSERFTDDHFPRVSDLLTLGGKVRCEPKDVHLAPHMRAYTDEVEAPKVDSNAHLHGFYAVIAQQMIERILNRIEGERPCCHTECSNSPIVKPPFTVEACKDTVTAETQHVSPVPLNSLCQFSHYCNVDADDLIRRVPE